MGRRRRPTGSRRTEISLILPRSFDQAVTRCFFLVMLAMACLMPAQNDTWWHLRAGQEMWQRGTLLFADEWSFTAAGAPWPNHEWLSELVFYAVYRLAGLPGLTLLAALCVTTGLALAWRLMAGTPMQRLLFLGLAMASISPVWTVRPHVFTFVLVMVVLHLVLRGRYWWIPPIFAIWANLHGGVALGIVILGGVLVGTVYVSGRAHAKPLLAVLGASFFATWITPLGPSLWWEIPVSIQRSAANRIVEWRAPSLFEPAHVAFWVAGALMLATTMASWRRVRDANHAALIAVALLLLPLALRSRRNVPPFLLVAIPALTQNLAHRLETWKERPRRENPRLNAGLFVACAAVCAAIVATAWTGPSARLQWQPIPPAIAAAAESCGDRVYNRYQDGGPLIWFAPGVKVFIDSRQDPYPVPFVQEYIRMEETGEYRAAFERYAIRCAVLSESSLVAQRLLRDGWNPRTRVGDWLVLGPTRH